ncbi:MAG: hypothetical protein ABH821_03590 [archaeon]
MMSFIALDNNCYLTFVLQRNKVWLPKIELFLNNLPFNSLRPVINKRSRDYVVLFALAIENLLSDKYSRELLLKYSKSKSVKNKEKLKLFVNVVDENQFEQVIESCLLVLRKSKEFFHLIVQNSLFVRKLIDGEKIKFLDLGRKKNSFSSKLFKTDSEDAIMVEELFAIKEKKFLKGSLYSEDIELIELAGKENTRKTLGLKISHIKELHAA